MPKFQINSSWCWLLNLFLELWCNFAFADQTLVEERPFEQVEQGVNPPANAAQAIKIGHQALYAYQGKNYEEALVLFEEAEQLAYSPVFVLYEARSALALGQMSRGLALLKRCASQSIGNQTPASWVQAIEAAQLAHREEYRSIPYLGLEWSGDVEFPLLVELTALDLSSDKNGATLGSIQHINVLRPSRSRGGTTLELRAAEGRYLVTGTDASGRTVSQIWQARATGRATIVLSFKKNTKQAPHTDVANVEKVPPGGSDQLSAHKLRRGAVAAFASGGALLVTSAITFGVAVGLAHQVKSKCGDGFCPADESMRAQHAFSLGQLSTATLVGGILGVMTGVTLVLIDRQSTSKFGVQLMPERFDLVGTF